MVLEYLYPLKLIERNPTYAFILGLCYSIIGIGIAVIFFPEDPTLVSLAFISLIIYPTVNSLMKQEEELEAEKEDKNVFMFFRDHNNIFKVYAFLFLGLFIGYAIFSMILPSLAANHLFEAQLEPYKKHVGNAIAFDQYTFQGIFSNNLSVMILCFLSAFIIGDGAIFFIAWNASVWGTIFGLEARAVSAKHAGLEWAFCNSSGQCITQFAIALLIILFVGLLINLLLITISVKLRYRTYGFKTLITYYLSQRKLRYFLIFIGTIAFFALFIFITLQTGNIIKFIVFYHLMFFAIWHIIIEAFAYILAASAGGVISKALIREKISSPRFHNFLFNIVLLMIFAFIILSLGALIETALLSNVSQYSNIRRLAW